MSQSLYRAILSLISKSPFVTLARSGAIDDCAKLELELEGTRDREIIVRGSLIRPRLCVGYSQTEGGIFMTHSHDH